MAACWCRTQRGHSACIDPFLFWVNERKSNVYGLDDVGWLRDGVGYTIVPRGCWNLVEKMASLVLCGVSLVREGENEGVPQKREKGGVRGRVTICDREPCSPFATKKKNVRSSIAYEKLSLK